MLENIKQGKTAEPQRSPATHCGAVPKDEKLIDIQWEIGNPAGTVWKHLSNHGKMTVEELAGKSNLNPVIFERAIGWLAKENKICMTQTKGVVYVYLTPTEQIIAQRRQAQAEH